MRRVRLATAVPVREMDPINDKLPPNAHVILLMGPSGSGKSSLIEMLASNKLDISSKSLNGMTHDIRCYQLTDPETRQQVVLVDTPGMADSKVSELTVIKELARWVRSHASHWSSQNKKTNPIRTVYLEPINLVRKTRSRKVGLDVFKGISGRDAARSTTIVTTMWNQMKEDRLDIWNRKREELLSTVWQDYIGAHAETVQFDNSFKSAAEVLSVITRPINSAGDIYTEVEKEVMQRDNRIKDTQVGRVAYVAHSERFDSTQATLGAVRADLADPSTKQNPELFRILKHDEKQLKGNMRMLAKEKKEIDKSSDRHRGCFNLHLPLSKSHSTGGRWH